MTAISVVVSRYLNLKKRQNFTIRVIYFLVLIYKIIGCIFIFLGNRLSKYTHNIHSQWCLSVLINVAIRVRAHIIKHIILSNINI